MGSTGYEIRAVLDALILGLDDRCGLCGEPIVTETYRFWPPGIFHRNGDRAEVFICRECAREVVATYGDIEEPLRV